LLSDDACTVSEQLPALSVQLPRLVVFTVKVMVLVGVELGAVESLTAAVNTVEPLAKMSAGLAVSVVAVVSAVTAMLAVPDEAWKPVAPP